MMFGLATLMMLIFSVIIFSADVGMPIEARWALLQYFSIVIALFALGSGSLQLRWTKPLRRGANYILRKMGL